MPRGIRFPVACGMLVPRLGIELTFPCMGRQILNHWTPGEVLHLLFFNTLFHLFIWFIVSSLNENVNSRVAENFVSLFCLSFYSSIFWHLGQCLAQGVGA